MKKFLTTAAILSVTATAAFANPNYPLEVVRNGVTYNCAPEIVNHNGVNSRRCVNASSGGTFSGGGLGGFGASVGIAAALITVIIIAADSDDEPTNGTN